jgi:uroporphyrinogen-III synthase
MDDVLDRPVLVPDASGQGRELSEALRAAGLQVDHSPLVELRLERDTDARRAVESLRDGGAMRVLLCGPRAVDLVLTVGGDDPADPAAEEAPSLRGFLPDEVEVLAAGHTTGAALRAAGVEPDAQTLATGPDLAAELPPPPAEDPGLLVLGSAADAAALVPAVQARGYRPTWVTAFRPKPVDADHQLIRDLRLGGYSALVLSEPLLAALAGSLGIHQDIRVIAIDAATARAAEAKRLVVHGQAAEPTPSALAAATRAALLDAPDRA